MTVPSDRKERYPHDSAAECLAADCGTCAPQAAVPSDRKEAARLDEIATNLFAGGYDGKTQQMLLDFGDALAIAAELLAVVERYENALKDIALYEEPWPQDPSDVYEHFEAVARAALAGTEESDKGGST